MATYHPSARVKLTLRLDEGTDTRTLERQLDTRPTGTTAQLMAERPPPPQTPVELQRQIDDFNNTLRALERQRDELPPEWYDRFREDIARQRDDAAQRLAQVQTGAEQVPQAVDGVAPDDRVVVGAIAPLSAHLERNSIREADTATITLPWSDVPFDPRLIRSCAVELTIGVVTDEDFAAGADGRTRQDGSLQSMVDRGPAAQELIGQTRFVGVVDTWAIELDGSDGDTVTLTCRDMTALLIDTPLPTGGSIDLSQPLDRGVQAFLDTFPGLRGIPVVYGQPGEHQDAPTPQDSTPMARRPRGGRGRGRRARRGDQRMSVWDHLTDICVQVGVVPMFEDYQLRLINPRTFFGDESSTRRMVYGRNLDTLGFERKMAGTKVPTIEVRCYDPHLGRTRWARYPSPVGARSGVFGEGGPPPRAARANEVPPSGRGVEDRIDTYVVSGINDPATLENAARSIWEQIGRQELEGTFQTNDPASYGRSFAGADLIQVRAGDAIELLVASAAVEDVRESLTTATVIESLSVEARSRYLQSLGWAPNVAERFAQLQQANAWQTVFRVQSAAISFSQSDGLSVSVDFVNFLVVRELSQDAPDPRQPPPPSQAVAEATSDRRGLTDTEARFFSGQRRLLNQWREAGILQQADYDQQMAHLLAVEQRRIRAAEEQ